MQVYMSAGWQRWLRTVYHQQVFRQTLYFVTTYTQAQKPVKGAMEKGASSWFSAVPLKAIR